MLSCSGQQRRHLSTDNTRFKSGTSSRSQDCCSLLHCQKFLLINLPILSEPLEPRGGTWAAMSYPLSYRCWGCDQCSPSWLLWPSPDPSGACPEPIPRKREDWRTLSWSSSHPHVTPCPEESCLRKPPMCRHTSEQHIAVFSFGACIPTAFSSLSLCGLIVWLEPLHSHRVRKNELELGASLARSWAESPTAYWWVSTRTQQVMLSSRGPWHCDLDDTLQFCTRREAIIGCTLPASKTAAKIHTLKSYQLFHC